MSVKINLLPSDLTVSKSLGDLLKTIRALSVIGAGAFLVFLVGVGAYFLVSTLSLNALNTSITSLKNQVSTQEKTEQQVVLLKDRLGKISSIESIPGPLPNLMMMRTLLAPLSGNTLISQMQVEAKGTDLTLNIKSNSDLAAFFDAIKNSDNFKSVYLTTLSLNPSTGYSTEVQIVKK